MCKNLFNIDIKRELSNRTIFYYLFRPNLITSMNTVEIKTFKDEIKSEFRKFVLLDCANKYLLLITLNYYTKALVLKEITKMVSCFI
jgi:hypothetical protein